MGFSWVRVGFEGRVKWGYMWWVRSSVPFRDEEKYPRGTAVTSVVLLIAAKAEAALTAAGNLFRGQAFERLGGGRWRRWRSYG